MNIKKYIYDKKQFNHIVKWKNMIDVNLQHYMEYNKPLYIEDITTNTHDYFNRKYYKMRDINIVIPILKYLELCRKLSDEYQKYIDLPVHKIYNVNIIDNLTYLESSGLRYNDEMVYSEYNLYTSTGRPSNRFGGINFAALNKTDGSRKPFKSRFSNGMLVEFDYDAYHLRLIGEVVDYKFPEGSVHKHMAKFYGDVTYDESKNRSFQYLYGHIPIDVVQINPFFSAVHDYINKIWSEYKYGKCDKWIIEQIEKQKTENRFYLLCKPDIPWKADSLRENPINREELFEIYKEELEKLKHNYVIIEGEERIKNSISKISSLISNN